MSDKQVDPLVLARVRVAELRKQGLLKTQIRKSPIVRAKENPKSLKWAVKGKCWDCQGGDYDSHPQWRIGNCEITDCPLWTVRPWQHKYGTPTPKGLLAEESS